MLRYLFFCVLFFLISCSDSIIEPATDASNQSLEYLTNVEKLNINLVDLKSDLANIPNESFKKLDFIQSAKIIGLGEATHGTQESIIIKSRLFKYFVEKFNHRIFAIEMDFCESLLFEKYIQTGEGDLDNLISKKMLFYTWKTQEMKDFLVWMKNYNASKSESQKLHFVGIDCQFSDYCLPDLVSKVGKLDSQLGANISDWLEPLKGNTNSENSKLVVEKVRQAITFEKEKLVGLSSEKEYNTILQIVNVIDQTLMVKTQQYLGVYPTSRDKFMADNVIWAKGFFGDSNLTICAHNVHVDKTLDNFMGKYLSTKFGNDFKSIGLSVGEGTFEAFNPKLNNTLTTFNIPSQVKTDFGNALFTEAIAENFFVKTAPIFSFSSIKSYFDQKPMFQVGLFYDANDFKYDESLFTKLTENSYDLIFHIETSNHIKVLD